MSDLIIKNGLLFDGTGRESFSADVRVTDGKIAEITDPGTLQGDGPSVIDAKGYAVLPALVYLAGDEPVSYPSFRSDMAEQLIRKGYGVIAALLEGESPFPRSVPEMTALRNRRLKPDEIEAWQAGTLAKWMRLFQDSSHPLPVLPFTGFGPMHRGVIGPLKRTPWPDEIRLEEYLLQQSFEQGSWGLSVSIRAEGPGAVSPEELAALARLCYVWDRTLVLTIDPAIAEKEKVGSVIAAAGETGARVFLRKDRDESQDALIRSVCRDPVFEEELLSGEGKTLTEEISDRTMRLFGALGMRDRGAILPGLRGDLMICPAERVSEVIGGRAEPSALLIGGSRVFGEGRVLKSTGSAFVLRIPEE